MQVVGCKRRKTANSGRISNSKSQIQNLKFDNITTAEKSSTIDEN
jgi:hypothetical protein